MTGAPQNTTSFYLGTGLFCHRRSSGLGGRTATLRAVFSDLDFGSLLDIARGTGCLTQSFHGSVVGLDQSGSMLAIARSRFPRASFVRGDALHLPFRPKQFDCVASCHFYGHLDQPSARGFLAEARRVASSVLIVDAAKREQVPDEKHQGRVLNDGSHHLVYKRFFTPERLMAEIGAGQVLHMRHCFVAVLASAPVTNSS